MRAYSSVIFEVKTLEGNSVVEIYLEIEDSTFRLLKSFANLNTLEYLEANNSNAMLDKTKLFLFPTIPTSSGEIKLSVTGNRK